MKKVITTTILGALAFLIMLGNVQAQKKYINKASLWANDGVKLDTALNAVVFCETQEKTKDWFKTYYAKGLVFEAIAKTENEEFKNLSDKPLIYAFDNFKKSYNMDGSKAVHTSLDLKFVNIANSIINVSVVAYEDEDFVKAFEYLEKSLEVKTMPVFDNVIDTAIIYNIAYIASKNKDWDNAIKYYKKAIELNYGEGDTYASLAESYKSKGDSSELSISTLKEGFEKYPGNQYLLAGIINYYILESDNTEEAFKYLAVAREKDPENPQFYSAEAHLYD
ncbi:MAG: tetratricopeptide repeat protein, partial [Bacteroidales bacterium]|nr:tetratricopeptide repeat protein [Bacteroidales bacterium]